jgi:hypothetical protein
LTGHQSVVNSAAVLPDGRRALSGSDDHTLRLWDLETGATLRTLKGHLVQLSRSRCCWTAAAPFPAPMITRCGCGTSSRPGKMPKPSAIRRHGSHYCATAGSVRPGWRIAHGAFREHSSTHGQQFWVIDQLGGTRQDGTQCEAVLWDLAGQPDYRLIHALFLDQANLGLLLFDPTNRERPLAGVEYWSEIDLRVGRTKVRSRAA